MNEFNLTEIERQTIIKALEHFNKKIDAAKALNISLKSLYNKINQFGLEEQYITKRKEWWV